MNSTQNVERAGTLGRLLRLLTGGLVLIIAISAYVAAPPSTILQSILVMLGLIAFYILLDLVINQVFPTINPVLGAVLANVPVLLMVVLGTDAMRLGALAFLAISLVLTGLRADKGCEVMSIPGFIFKRHTQLACLVFSPVDWLERRLVRSASSS